MTGSGAGQGRRPAPERRVGCLRWPPAAAPMMNLEAIEMLRVRTGTVPVWMVRLTVRFQRGGRPAPRVERIECMAERLRRSEGVSAAAVVPGPEGLAAVVGVHARDGAIATERARALVAAAAAGSGIDGVMVHRAGLPVRAAERR